ncbi:phosphatidate cytidylyltransferase, mitochondrial-like [Ostrea edulis]|uniref:phosphatidate cytidylyltransferase, mitochondrial-like n=1 Tax=Ostrea edulis TaxID=37623 RepID=UPI002095DD11|nr:phosphatidate cytidylyltransferase, mitochondrial-like [Ostrea edulis]
MTWSVLSRLSFCCTRCHLRHYATSSKLDHYEAVLEKFPGGIQMAFAYGSGVFKQMGQSDAQIQRNMIDLIFVVDDSYRWHQQNIKQNRKHYSFLKYLGAKQVAKIQEKYGAAVYFNTKVQCAGREIKYGVISTKQVIIDLLDWSTLYVSGRMHKPIRILIPPTKVELCSAIQINLENAVHAALLLLPETFTEEELYQQIAALSYDGDFRMKFGEDKNKISNIVTPNMAYFRKLYEQILLKDEHVKWNMKQGILEQYPNHVSQFHHLNLLPKTVQLNLLSCMHRRPGKYPDLEEIIRQLAFDSNCADYVRKGIAEIVRSSSIGQSLKSIYTAGLVKSVLYSSRKVQKMVDSKKNEKNVLQP